MKVIYSILIFCLLAVSCKDDGEETEPALTGQWQYVYGFFSGKSGITRNGGISFTIGDTLYTGLGMANTATGSEKPHNNNLWRYTHSGGWEQMASLPGEPRTGAVAFVIGRKAYVGLGRSVDGGFCRDFWIYDAAENSWEALSVEFPGDPVSDAVAFSLNGVGYVGTGLKANGQYSSDFYYFDLRYGWGEMNNMVLPRAGATTFQLNGTAYLCFGRNDHESLRDVYKFNQEEFRFIPLNSLLPDKYPGITRSYASSFTLTEDGQEYAYIVGGNLGLDVAPPYWHCCRYNYLTDEWEEVLPMPRTSVYVTTFTRDNAGYVLFDDMAYRFVP